MMHEWVHCCDEAANYQLPIAAAFWIIWIVSMEEWMFKLNAKFDVDSLLCLFSHFECDGHTVQILTQWHVPPPWLVQWSCHCSCVHIPVHSPLLPGYTNVVQTILIILIVAGLFLDRPDAQIEKKKGREWWLNKVLSLWNFLTLLYRKCRLSLIYFEVFKLYLLIKKLSKFNLYSFGFNMIFYLVYNVLL